MSTGKLRSRVVLGVVGLLLLGGAVALGLGLGLPRTRAWLLAHWAGAAGGHTAQPTDHADHDHDAEEDGHQHDEAEGPAGEHAHAADKPAPGEPPHDHEHDEAGCLALSKQAKANIGLRLARVELRPFERTISVPGMVVERPGWSTLEVTAPMTGVVTRIYPIQGEAVQPGQPLFEVRLTHEDLLQKQTEFLRIVEELEVIGREVERLEKVAGQGAIAGKTLLERQYEQQKQQAALRAQRQSLLLHGLSDEQVDEIAQVARCCRA